MVVSFVIPCYREEEALAALQPHLAAIPAEEIVFVDDGSDDGTPDVLAAFAATDARVHVATHASNRGVGAAMRTGIAATHGDVVVIYDADRTYPLQDARKLIAALGDGVDVASATPFAPGGGLADVPAARSLLSRAARACYRLVLGPRARKLTVLTCAFRAWRGPLLRALDWSSDGFPAAAEMLGRALLAGARIVEVPSPLRRRSEGASKMRVLPVTLGHLATLARLFWARASGPAAPRREHLL